MLYFKTFSDTMPAAGWPRPGVAAILKSKKNRFRNSPRAGNYGKHIDISYRYILMKPILSFAVIAALVISAPRAVAQDVTHGTILGLDRMARLLVLEDRTVWSLELMSSDLSASLKAGDRIEITYESDEEGVGEIKSIVMLPPRPPAEGAPDATDGTVLVYDRKANLLILTDRTVWALEALKSPLPAGIEAGSRVHIEYESDEEGVSAINNISMTLN